MSSTCTAALTDTVPFSISRKTHALAAHCSNTKGVMRVSKRLCHERDVCTRQSCGSNVLPDQTYYGSPVANEETKTFSRFDWTKACSASKWHKSKRNSHAVAASQRIKAAAGVGENVSKWSIPSRGIPDIRAWPRHYCRNSMAPYILCRYILWRLGLHLHRAVIPVCPGSSCLCLAFPAENPSN